MTTNHQLPLKRVSRSAPRADDRSSRSLRVAGLFAGIGGIELGLSAAGHSTGLLCENDPGASEVLARRFPTVPLHADVTTLRSLPKDTELVAAGFPCQDLSQAGQTKGISGERSGLISEVLRLLRTTRVPHVLIENVSFMLQLAKGHALRIIVEEFEKLGYKWAYRVVDSRAFGVPQRRERVYFLASLVDDPRNVLLADDAGVPVLPTYSPQLAFGFYWTEGVRGLGAAVDCVPTLKGGSTIGIPSAPAILLPNGRVVTPHIRDAERMQGFPPDWTAPASSRCREGHRWKLVGNAVTVSAARWIGERLAQPGVYDPSWDASIPEGAPWPRAAWNDGSGRRQSCVSSWPYHVERGKLHEFLENEPRPLSARATKGFLTRARRGSLRFPEGFLAAVEAHLVSVGGGASSPADHTPRGRGCETRSAHDVAKEITKGAARSKVHGSRS